MVPIAAVQLGLIVAIAIGCVALWNYIFAARSAGQPIIPYEPRCSVPWGPRDIALIALGTILIIRLCMVPLSLLTGDATEARPSTDTKVTIDDSSPAPDQAAEKPADQPAEEGAKTASSPKKQTTAETFSLVLAGAAGTMISFFAAIAWLRFRGATSADIGFDLSRLGRDVSVGFAGFVAASIPIYIIQIIAVQFIPAEHPVSEIFQASPGAVMVLATVISAVIVAPLTEEFFFRVVLQGWLEARFAERADDATASLPVETDPAPSHADPADSEHPIIATMATADDPTPAVPSSTVPHLGAMPIVLSAFIFAIVHLDYGPSAIPLFFFAIVLGYLYRQTHRLWPSVITHASLNALSTFIMLTSA